VAQRYGLWSIGSNTAAGGTPFASLIPPAREITQFPGAGLSHAHTVITNILYSYPITATHVCTIMRPLNYTMFSAAAAGGQAVVNITANPGSFSTVFNYPMRGSVAARTANTLLAATHYVVYQCPDGTYVLDTVASISSLAVTLTNNLPTGGVAAGDMFWMFGAPTSVDPTTAMAHLSFSPARAPAAAGMFMASGEGLFTSLHPGDPMIFYSNNATTAGFLELCSGYYERGEI
jgi:hypothetical protein